MPRSCDCELSVRNVYTQARQYTLPVLLVGDTDQQRQLEELDRRAADGGAVPTADEGRALAGAYDAEDALVLVLVHADGVVGGVLPADPDTRYESALVQLSRAG